MINSPASEARDGKSSVQSSYYRLADGLTYLLEPLEMTSYYSYYRESGVRIHLLHVIRSGFVPVYFAQPNPSPSIDTRLPNIIQ